MHEWQSLSHVRWDCKYHVVIIPKYRRKVFYGRLRRQIGPILRDLCRQRGIELLEGHAMPDPGHLCLSIPPKSSVAFVLGFLKGKSAVRIHRELLHERGRIPEESHAAIAPSCSEGSSCDAGGLITPPEFNSATRSGASQRHSRRRSCAIAAWTASIVSCQRPVNAAARSTSIASAFSSHQEIPLPFSRRLITRRIALSIAPLPSGRPRYRNQS